ncbi:MAG: peptidoglycan bridge formation glycyltransferase FemA/FemB family protein [Candidatus Gracilibacteria bacterium]|nr:peptidoglycan bridge formation glycyltransferase FemA/FemB family protein [Candidatus Gracilibacteria bacterium]
MPEFREITDRDIWEQFTPLQENGLFLQSYDHKTLNEEMGQRTWLFEISENDKSIRSLVTKIEAKRGTFLYLPYGPMFASTSSQDLFIPFFNKLQEIAQQEGASFIRVSPFLEESTEHLQCFTDTGFRRAPLHMLAETLWVKDLSKKTEDELLQEMEKKHRNLVRRALKDGVKVRKTTDCSTVETFWSLYEQTFKRHKFTPYPKKLIQSQLSLFSKHDSALMLEAIYEEKVLGSALVMYYGNAGAYHHGASSSDPTFRKIPATYLLQWEAIKEAQRRGAAFYNFWGVAPYDLDAEGKRVYKHKNHPFNGITHFKTGFGGRRLDLVPCQDLVISWKYWFTYMIESFRKWKRGF